ncbi:Hsp70 family protein [Desulfobacterales bacterium HSG17]|nr:Hsp70 family protein [Desulfobacterales bacterium HSG17]
MDFTDKQYIIGIDLGTTNCAVSYVDVEALKDDKSTGAKNVEKKNLIKIFNVPQLTGHGEFTRIPVLPSFLYIPGKYDISKEVLKHPWKKTEDVFAGSFARDHGSKIPSRLVSSAKSWLCNSEADRRAKILPWGASGFEKISPVTATAQYLNHIKSAWNHYVKDEDKFIENQFVVITVPASFNEGARQLTMDAVKAAGFSSDMTLLEEPLAAFYSWLINNENSWQNSVKPDDLILICDVGGGTTDFSLITLKESKGSPRFERIAVGDHLILGGDNIDLALSKKVESRFAIGSKTGSKSGVESKIKLNSDKWKTLCYQCREAKEKILDQGEALVRITIKGEGRSLIAGTLAADLTKEDIETLLLDEFYPYVEPDVDFAIDIGREITDFGLPLEKEIAVTKHIIRFLENHRDEVKKSLSKEPVPDFILFNGGTLKPEFVQERIQQVIGKYFKSNKTLFPKILENNIPELAVGIGASYYGLVKSGQGVKVGSGSPRNYYLEVADKNENIHQAVCLVERGLDEGSDIELQGMEYEVRTNQLVNFNIYSSSFRSGDKGGEIIPIDDSLSSMPPVQTIIKFGSSGTKKNIPVTIGAKYSEMGTLSMYCHSMVSDHKWELLFQLRETKKSIEAIKSKETSIYDESLIKNSCDLIEQAFTDQSSNNESLQSLVRQIEKIVAQKKSNWSLSFLRTVADKLIKLDKTRTYSPEHEARWLNLTGFCVRPGFGDGFDEERIRKLWKIYLSGLTFIKSQQNRLEWWIFIRRIAAGLKAGQQRQFFQDVSPFLIRSKNSKIKLSPQEQVELWMVVGNMERLLIKDKIVLAKALFPILKPNKKQDNMFWALSRIGARELLYGSVDRVVPSHEVVRWINPIMKKKWPKSVAVENMVAQISRKTGDRTRDIDSDDSARIVSWLQDKKVSKSIVKIVIEKTDMALKEKSIQFGEKLPKGLVLK